MTAVGDERVDAHELVAGRLSNAGQLYTQGRRELVDVLLHTARPATIPELRQLRPQRTQSSLYRNLADLEAVRVVRRVIGADELTRFEFSEDILGHHHHTICTSCGVVDDFTLPPSTEEAIESSLALALAGSGFEAATHRLDVSGTCAGCVD